MQVARGTRGRPTALILCIALLMVTAFAGLAVAQGSGVTITVVRGTDLWTGDPLNDTQATSRSFFHNVFDPLVRINWDDVENPLPALAVSWEVLSPTQIRFHLREGVTWHDGSSFTADDVKFTFDRMLDTENPTKVGPLVSSIIAGVTVEDSQTVVLETFAPYAPIFSRLATVFITPQQAFLEMGETAFGQASVGTGAYKVSDWQIGQYIELVANEDWWGWVDRETRPDVVIRKSVPEEFTRFAMLESGEADIVGQVAPERIPGIAESATLRIVTSPSLRTFFVGMNTWEPPFDNVLVRQAMNYAIDPQLIVDTILSGQATAHAGVCGVGSFGYCPDCEPYSYDPELAKSLLKAAGYEDGFKVTLWSPRGKYIKDLETSEAIAGQLQAIGLDVEIYAPAWAEYWDNFLAGNMNLYFLSAGISFPDCDDLIGYHLDSERRGIYYNSPTSDALIEQEQTTLDPVERAAVFEELSLFFVEEAPWIFLWDQNLIYGVNSRILDFDALPVEDIFYWNLVVK